MQTYIFKTQLLSEKSIQRDIEVPADMKLYNLAEAITRAYDFDFDHTFGFFSKVTAGWDGLAESTRYELCADTASEEARGAKSVMKTTVQKVWKKPKDRMLFLFDYGDEWRWIVTLVAFGEMISGTHYPRILSTKGKAPKQYSEGGE